MTTKAFDGLQAAMRAANVLVDGVVAGRIRYTYDIEAMLRRASPVMRQMIQATAAYRVALWLINPTLDV